MFKSGSEDTEEFHLSKLCIEKDGKVEEVMVIVKDMHRHPVSGAIQHIDFFAVKMDEKITAPVHIRLHGKAAGVKLGGILRHILREVELITNRMIIINRGTTQIEGEVEELLNKEKLSVTFEVGDIQGAIRIIKDSIWAPYFKSKEKNEITFEIDQPQISELNAYLIRNNIEVSAVIPKRSLEEFFLKITEGSEVW